MQTWRPPANLGSRGQQKFVAAVLSLFLIGLAACSKTTTNESTPPSRARYASSSAVCALLKKVDLESLLGHRFSEGTGDFNPDTQIFTGVTTCSFGQVDHPNRKTYLGVVYAYSDQIFTQVSKILRDAFPGKIEVVKGIGEQALWFPDISLFFVLSGQTIVVVQSFPDLEPPKDVLIRLRRVAEKVDERLN